MPTVRMVSTVSGTRDGVAWPPPGETIDVGDDEAADLIATGVAEAADAEHDSPAPTRAAGSQQDEGTPSAGIQGDALRTGRR